ncbi:MAG: hypothetical protein IKG44_05225 [Mogibacterium sp.]|nr:hypothetical protein [Mogibacterium sp.]MBR3377060.1 hypothetical protein [Mogibacterium sp.]
MSDKGRKIINIILALLVSMAAWVFVVYNYDPMTKEKYSGIPITYTGLETLANRGYAVAETNHERVDVTLEQKRIDTGNIGSEDISVTADVSQLSSGQNTVALHVEGPEDTSVSDISLKTVTIEIESSDSEDMEISVEYPAASAEDDAEPIVEELSETEATVIATSDRLARVDRVAAVIDPNDLNDKLKPLTVDLAALDAEGNRVLNVVVYPQSVSFKAAAGYVREVRLVVPVKDDSDDNYERTHTVRNTIVIKGSKDLVNKTGSITADEIDISQYYEDAEIPLTFELPDGIYLEKGYEAPVLKLKVKEKATEEEAGDSQTG